MRTVAVIFLLFTCTCEFAAADYFGKWFLENPSECRLKAGISSELIEYTPTEVIGPEIRCKIRQAIKTNSSIELVMRCIGEGEVVTQREVVEVVGERLKVTSRATGKTFISTYRRCPKSSVSVLASDGPGFDCRKARLPDELAICSDPKLRELDRLIVAAFNKARTRQPTEVRSRAVELLDRRHACNSNKTCIMKTQIESLQFYRQYAPEVSVPAWIGDVESKVVELPQDQSTPPPAGLPLTKNGFEIESKVAEPKAETLANKTPISIKDFNSFLERLEKALMCSRELSRPSRFDMDRYRNVILALEQYPSLKGAVEAFEKEKAKTRENDRKVEAYVRLAARDILIVTCQENSAEIAKQADRIEKAIIQVGGTVSHPSTKSCGVTDVAAGASDGKKFRGIYINMTRENLENWKSTDFKLVTEPCKAQIISIKTQKKCAEVSIGPDDRIEKMIFQKCYFGADDLEFEPFAKAIVNNYGLPGLNCKTNSLYSKDLGSYVTTQDCAGAASTGEWVSISVNTLGILGSNTQMTVTRRSSHERPKFD